MVSHRSPVRQAFPPDTVKVRLGHHVPMVGLTYGKLVAFFLVTLVPVPSAARR